MKKIWFGMIFILGVAFFMMWDTAQEKNVSMVKVVQKIPQYSQLFPSRPMGTIAERVRLEFHPTPPPNVRYIETEILPLQGAPESPDGDMFARYGSAVQMDVTPLLNVQDGDYVAIRFKGGYYHGRVMLRPKINDPDDKSVSFGFRSDNGYVSSVLIIPFETHTYFRVGLEGFPGYVIRADSSGIGRAIRSDEFSAILEKMKEQP